MGGGGSAQRAAGRTDTAAASAAAIAAAATERERVLQEREQERREYIERQEALALEAEFYRDHHRDHLDEVSDDGLDADHNDDENRQSWALVSNSLGMDQDDLLFNMLYFNEGNGVSIGAAINNAIEETVALHSESNTPYKLKPASPEDLQGLSSFSYDSPSRPQGELSSNSNSNSKSKSKSEPKERGGGGGGYSAPSSSSSAHPSSPPSPSAGDDDESPHTRDASASSASPANATPKHRTCPPDSPCDSDAALGCLICKDDLLPGCAAISLPNCGHLFHDECLRKWLGYQNWCPVCRCEVGVGGGGKERDSRVSAVESSVPGKEDWDGRCKVIGKALSPDEMSSLHAPLERLDSEERKDRDRDSD